MSKKITCHSCKGELIKFKKFSNYYLVSSDCKPTYMKGDISICAKCSLIQKPINTIWKKRVKVIYKEYEMFKNAKGEDQKLFNSEKNNQSDRSTEILNLISSKIKFPTKGKVLDIGCGTGGHLIELLNLGYNVIGIDNSNSMLEIAYKKLLQVLILQKQLPQV